MEYIIEKICEFGPKRDKDLLKGFINDQNVADLEIAIKSNISNATFACTWHYILQGFAEDDKSHKKRMRLVLSLLQELERLGTDFKHTKELVLRLCVELSKFRSEDLAELCNYCLNTIQSEIDRQMSWKDLLPELLNVLVERETFYHNEIKYTGLEFRAEVVNNLIVVPWRVEAVTTLIACFTEMPLSKEEHLKIVSKLLEFLDKMMADEVPPFTYQMLRLCRQQNGRSLFFRLQNYFHTRIYLNCKNNAAESNSENTDLDLIESADNRDCIEAESRVLFHINNASLVDYHSIKDYVQSLKNLTKAPEVLLHPFQLSVLFTIAKIVYNEEAVFDVVRHSITRVYYEEEKRANNNWFRDMVAKGPDLDELFRIVINQSLEDRPQIIQSLINFGIALLNVGSALGRDVMAEKQWRLGTLILLKIVKSKWTLAPVIIKLIRKCILTNHSAFHCIEFIYILSTKMKLLLLENQSNVVELMDSLMLIPGKNANFLLDAVIPLAKFSPTLRDHLILLLRKSLFSRSTETRQMAANGFLKLLTHFKISNLAALSQSSSSSGSFSSSYSIFTQIYLSKTASGSQLSTKSNSSNEALCLEVLSILKRCFMQQAEVKKRLYEDITKAVSMNPELSIPVLDVIWQHFSNSYIIDENILPPIDIEKIAIICDTDAILQEPLGMLIYASSLIVCKKPAENDSNEEENENPTAKMFKSFLNFMCSRFSRCELVHFQLDDGTDLGDILPKSQQKARILEEVLCIYESLIAYKIMSWQLDSRNYGRDINDLFTGYNRLLLFAKNVGKSKKGAGKKKNADNTQSNDSTVKKDQSGPKGGGVKLPDTVLGFECIEKALSLLLEPEVDWALSADSNVVKSRKEIHRHFMQITIQAVQKLKNRKYLDQKVKEVHFNHLCSIAAILYKNVVDKMDTFLDFDCVSALSALHCFHVILALVANNFQGQFELFLSKIMESDENRWKKLIGTYEALFEMDSDGFGDPEMKRMPNIVLATIHLLAGQLTGEAEHETAAQLYDWLKNIAYNNVVSTKTSTVFINLLIDVHIKYKIDLNLLESLAGALGRVLGYISEEDKNSVSEDEFKIVNEATVYTILQGLCTGIKALLDVVDGVILRLKSQHLLLSTAGNQNIKKKREDLIAKERGVSCQLVVVLNILKNLSNLSMIHGGHSEVIIKSLINFFTTLIAFTKYLITRATKQNNTIEGARFDRLVRFTSRQLIPIVHKFIFQIDSKVPNTATQSKNSNLSVKLLLKETRLIPKLIHHMEEYGKFIVQLSSKAEIDLVKYVGQGVVRDSRIIHLKEVLEQGPGSSTQSTEGEASEQGSLMEEDEDNDVKEVSVSDSEGEKENSPSPSKRRK